MLDLWFRRCHNIHMNNKKTSRISDKPGLSPARLVANMGTKRWSRPWFSTALVGLAVCALVTVLIVKALVGACKGFLPTLAKA